MNKKQMKKEQEKLKMERKDKPFDLHEASDVKKTIIITLGVILFLALVYVVINIAKGNFKLFTRSNENVDIDTSLVICGTMLNKPELNYIVMAYDFNSKEEEIYAAMSSKYTNNGNTLYLLDLSDALNKSCITKDNTKINLNDISFNGPTLIEVKDNKAVKSYTTKNSILNVLNK